MALRLVFFGNSASSYSNQYYWGFVHAPCRIVTAVDSPPRHRSTTTAAALGTLTDFVTHARQVGTPVLEPAAANLPEFVAGLQALEPDLLVAVGYMGLFREALLAVPRLVAVNFHASLLPAYRGKHPVFWALRNGERWSGLTVHVIDQGLDTGDMLYQVKVRTRRDDRPADLYERIWKCSGWLPSRLVQDAEQSRLRRRPQPSEGASYYSAVKEEDFRIEWPLPAERLRRMICVSPGQCFADVASQRLFFLDAEVMPGDVTVRAGTLLRLGRASGLIQCGAAALRIGRVRMGASEPRPFAQACRELHVAPGEALQAPAMH